MKQEQTRELAGLLAGAWHSRRIYAQGSPVWQKTLDVLKTDIDQFFSASDAEELTFALLGDGLAVSGVPIVNAPGPVARLASQLKARDIEIIALRRECKAAAVRGTVDMGPIMELSSAMLGLIVSSDTPIATLLALRDRDDFTYVHSVNVGMLAGCQAASLGLPEKEVEEISAAGLVHDIGKTRVPEAILQKKSPLTLQEQALMVAHSMEGARLLYSAQGAHRLPAIVAAEHHRPGSAEGSEPPLLASQLVSVADAFDSLRTLRPFDDRHSMRGALVYMFEKLRGRFNPYLLSRFGTLCGMFTPGDFAQLTTGEVVKVVKLHAESAVHPTVEVIDTAVGSVPNGTTVDLSQQKGAPRPLAIRLPMTEAFGNLDPRELDSLG